MPDNRHIWIRNYQNVFIRLLTKSDQKAFTQKTAPLFEAIADSAVAMVQLCSTAERKRCIIQFIGQTGSSEVDLRNRIVEGIVGKESFFVEPPPPRIETAQERRRRIGKAREKMHLLKKELLQLQRQQQMEHPESP